MDQDPPSNHFRENGVEGKKTGGRRGAKIGKFPDTFFRLMFTDITGLQVTVNQILTIFHGAKLTLSNSGAQTLVYQNHKVLLKHRLLGPMCRVSDSVGLERDISICPSDNLPRDEENMVGPETPL